MKKFLLSAAMSAVAAFSMSADYYIVGQFNDWANGAEDCKLTETAANVYEISIADFQTSGGFLITDGTWDLKFGAAGGEKLTVGEPMELVIGGGDNITLDRRFVSVNDARIIFTYTDETATLVVEGTPVEGAVSDAEYYIVGQFNGWSNGAEDCKLTQTAADVYEISFADFQAAGGFLITDGTWDLKFGADGDETLTVGEPMNLVIAGGNNINLDPRYMSVTDARIIFTYTDDAATLLVEGTPVEDPNYDPNAATPLYLRGTVTSWDFDESQSMTYDEAIGGYYFRGLELAGEAQYKIAGKDWNPNYGKGDSTLPINNDNAATTLYKGSNPDNCEINLVGVYNMYAFMSDDTQTIDVEIYEADNDPFLGVEAVVADFNTPVVYYNLQGVQVNNPTNGIFICKQGNKVAKVVK